MSKWFCSVALLAATLCGCAGSGMTAAEIATKLEREEA
jgi:hypothetical protein